MLHKIIEIDGSLNFNDSNKHTLQTDSEIRDLGTHHNIMSNVVAKTRNVFIHNSCIRA